ncbi:hypothetical protein Aperf_G00000127491 [Anoplocephala perfoliata]
MKNTRIRHPDLATKLASTELFSTRLKSTDLLAVQPPTLGGIGQLPQTQRQESAVDDLKLAILRHSSGIKMAYSENAHGFNDAMLRPPSPEIINCFLSFAFLAIRIGITFWKVWPTFSYLTSILLMLTGIYLVVEYAAVGLLIQLTVSLTVNSNSTNIYGTLLMVRLPMRLTSWQMILLTSIGFVVTLSSYGVLFKLGVRQFHKAIQKNYYTVANVLRIAKENSNAVTEMLRPSTSYSEMPSFDDKNDCLKCRCWQMFDHSLIIFGFLSLVVSILVRIPCLCDIFLLYWNEKDYLCLTAVILFICIHLAWLMMWFGFAMKQKWSFHMPYPRAVPQCMDPSIQSQFLPEPTVQGNLIYTPITECDEEASLSLRNQTFFSPLHLQNPGMPFQPPLCLSNSTQVNATSTNPLKYPLKVPFSPEIGTGQIMTNKLYETNQLHHSGGSETFPMASHYLLAPAEQKRASIRPLNQWDTELSGGKQDVLINVAPAPLSQAQSLSFETVGGNDNRPQSVILQPMVDGGGNTSLRVAPVAVQESGQSGQSATSSGDQICSRV